MIFLFLSKNIYSRYSLEASHLGTSNECPQHIFLLRNKKKYQYFIWSYVILNEKLTV